MAWRIIQQPNGLFARYSEVVDSITEYDMIPGEVIDLCMKEYGLSVDTAHWKLNQAMLNTDRWQNALNSMRAVHGQGKANHLERVCSQMEKTQ